MTDLLNGAAFSIAIYAVLALAALLTIGIVIARLYKRSTKEIAFVRTGFGGEKVVMNGGALLLPVLHESMPVNMNTVRLAVERKHGDALITLDRLRIDEGRVLRPRAARSAVDRHRRADAGSAHNESRSA